MIEQIKGTDSVPEGFWKSNRNFTKTNQQLNEIDKTKIGWVRVAGIDLDTVFYNVEAYCLEAINRPTKSNGYFKCMQIGGGIDATRYAYHTYTAANGNKYDRVCYDSVWQPWKPIATTDKIDIPFPFNTDFEEHFGFPAKLIINNSLRTCRLYLSVSRKDGGDSPITSYDIGTIPSSYRPHHSLLAPLSGQGSATNATGSSHLAIYGNGVCRVTNNYSPTKALFGVLEWDY